MVKIKSFPVKLSQAEARAMADKRMSFFGRALVRKSPRIELKTIFIENKIITYGITYEPPFFVKWFKKDAEKKKSKIRIIANGSTGGTALYDDKDVEIADLEVEDEQAQLSDFPDGALVVSGSALARRILRRRIGGGISLEPLEILSVFRPYHVVFFGEVAEGKRVRYMPIPADNCMVRKTF